MHNEPIAIVGMSALFPGSQDGVGFWRDIVAGRDLITDVPAHRWLIEDHYDPDPRAEDKTYSKRGAFLSPFSFDPLEFGVPPNAISSTDTCQLLSLMAAKRVLDDVARGQMSEIDRERTSVILGVTSGQQLFLEVSSRQRRPIWVKALRESKIPEAQVSEICDRIAASFVPWQESTFPGLLGNVVAGRIANRFDLHGTNCVTDAACASSLAAVSMAVDELRLGRSDLVITGGADTFNDVSMFVAFSKTPALSPSGDCRPFSDRADGTILGEGIAMFALKRLVDAERDGNSIYAVIRAIGSSSDGRSKSIYAPLPAGQARAMRRAYEEAGFGPETVELIEAHGTGTPAGDAAEVESLRAVFEPAAPGERQWCALGSVKSQVGHTKAAAGAAALFKTAMAIHHQTLPPTIKIERPNPALNLDASPFYLNTAARPWIPRHNAVRRAALSSFGFGGTNFHAVLEEYTGSRTRPKRVWPDGPELILASGDDAIALRESCSKLVDLCERETIPLANISLASQMKFDPAHPHRAAAIATNRAEMSRKLRGLADGKLPPGAHRGTEEAAGKIAFLFPGQGSQYPNMGAELAMAFREAATVWEKAPDVAAVAFPAPAFSSNREEEHANKLKLTQWAQPAVGAASAALLAVLNLLGVRPDCVGGHSFGEIPALFAAGAIDLDILLVLARRRGELMRDSSSEPAGMISVRSNWERVRGLLNGVAVTPANHNGPAQVVLSGSLGALQEAESRLRKAGFAVTTLPVSTAFHSPLMRPAAEAFARQIREIRIGTCSVPFYSNRDGLPHRPDGQTIGADLAGQITAPVLFADMIERMYADGVRTFVEVGPRDVLTSLVGGILGDREHRAIALDRAGQGLRAFWEGVGALAVRGVAMDWRRLRHAHAASSDLAESQKPKFSFEIDGGNYGRPYPPSGGISVLPPPVADVPGSPPPITAPAASSHDAYRTFQESIAAAHRDWQANLTKGHEAFLRTMEAALESAGGGERQPRQSLNPASPGPGLPLAFTAARSEPAPVSQNESAQPEAPREVLWEIVAEKTGYPAGMLEPEMALEADLGIDSIKRVEIFSALQDRFPALATMDQAAVTSLRTLGDVMAALSGIGQAGENARNAAAAASQPESSKTIVWEVVAEKTGYPAGMLEPGMALEADLGIDSIKRVEIFSALQEKFPALAGMDQAGVTSLRTLGDVVGALDGFGGGVEIAVEKTEVTTGELPKRYVVSPSPAPQSGYATLNAGDRIVLTGDDRGVDTALAGLLRSHGFQVTLGEDSPDANVWICLAGLRSIADGPACTRGLHFDALSFAKNASQRVNGAHGVFVTVQDDSEPWTGGMSGLAKTAGLEWPSTRVKAIRLSSGNRAVESVAKAVLDELLAGGPEVEIELRPDGSRLAPEVAELSRDSLAPAAAKLPANPVIVATGGARGITAACLKELVLALKPRLVLFGRTTIIEESASTSECPGIEAIQHALLADHRGENRRVTPLELREQATQILAAREVRETIRTLKHSGAKVRYFPIDARDGAAVAAALAEVRREWGPIRGVIHAAGILADKLIGEVEREQFDPVFSTKVEGLRVLLETTAQDPVALLAVFSSVAARYGNRGQAVYSMANEVLNRVAEAEAKRRAGSCIVRSFDWGPWEGGMVTPELAKQFAAANIPLIGLEAGARAFVKEILTDATHTEVVIGGPVPGRSRATGELKVRLHYAAHPHLNDHCIQNVPVLPLVEAVGLLLRAASANGKMRPPLYCSDLRVLRGVRLDGFYNGGNLLTVREREAGVFELVSADGTRHYEASILPPNDSPAAPPDPAPLAAAPWSESEIYNKLLFHGPEFHLIQDIEGVSDRGIAGTLRPRNGEIWRHGEGGYDPGMFDGGLQLARLWGFLKLGEPTLPMRVGAIRFLRNPDGAPIECRVFATAGANRVTCDISFLSLEKELLAVMTGVEMYAAQGA